MKKTIFACLACVGLLLACTPEDNPGSAAASITVDVEAINAETDGGNFNVKVTCNVPTTTTITYDSGEDWITLMPKVLKGNGTLSFTIKKFLDYDATRTAKATIKGNGVEKVITISQKGRPAPVATALDLNKTNVYADVIGGTFAVDVATAGAWTAASNAAWCTLENGSGNGIGSFNIIVARSEDYQYRTATVTVTAGELTRTVKVEHVGTQIGDLVWANANVNEPDTFGETCEVLGKLYQWNSKVGFPSYTAQNTDNDGCHGDDKTVVPGYEGGACDLQTSEWAEENNPCPTGWRVPTMDELKKLIGADNPPANKFTVYFWKASTDLTVSGAFCGLDREVLRAECSIANRNGSIFIPIAGGINRDTSTQTNWWNVMLWSSNTAGQTWDMLGMWLGSTNDVDDSGVDIWYGSKSALSVRCVLASN